MKRKILGFLIVCLLVGLVTVEATTKILTPDVSKSGYIISDGSYLQTGPTYCLAGDNSANNGYRGFLTFDLSTLPAGADITDVKLDLTSSTVYGNPFIGQTLGTMLVEQVRYGSTLDKNDYDTSPIIFFLHYISKPTTPLTGSKITDAVKNELSLGYTKFQVRVKFWKKSNYNGQYDYIRFTNPKLTITYTTAPPLNVEMWVDKGCGSTYNIGDPIKIYFEVNKACYITIKVTTSEGTKTTVPSQYVSTGTHYTSGIVGTPTGEHKLTIYASAGSENASDTCSFYAEENTGSIKIIVKDQDGNRIKDAKIYLNGSYKGKTNSSGEYTISNLSPGNYTVKTSKSGYEDDSESVHVEAGETDTVYLTLEEIPSPTTPAPTTPAPTEPPPTEPPTEPPTVPPTTPAPTGMLSVSKPQYKQGEAVEMYLESTGTTPIKLQNTAPWTIYKIEGGLFEVYKPVAAEVITEVTGHMSWIWNQKNNLDENAPEGQYKIVLRTLNAGEYSASFTITGEAATEPPTQPPTTQPTTTESPLSSLLENPIVLIGGAVLLLLLVLIIVIALKK